MPNDKTYFVEGREFYSATDAPVWPCRYRELPDMKAGLPKGPLATDTFAQHLLSLIDELERQSRPSAGGDAKGKDAAAFRALAHAAHLVRHVAGWAIDHQKGLALKELRFIPRGPPQTRTSPHYLEALAAVDRHEHERAGGANKKLSPVEARRFALNLIAAMGSNLGLPFELSEALEALDYGEVLPILQKVRTTKRTGLVEYRAKLTAVAYIEYQYKKGVLKKRSTEIVADTFVTTSIDSVRDWPVEVRAALGNLAVERTITLARNAGVTFKNPEHADIRDDLEARFGEPALLEAAARYKAR